MDKLDLDKILNSISSAPTPQEKIFRLCNALHNVDGMPIGGSSTDRLRTIVALQIVRGFFESLGAEKPSLRLARLEAALCDLDRGVVVKMLEPDFRSGAYPTLIKVCQAIVATGVDILIKARFSSSEIKRKLDQPRWRNLKDLVRPGKKLGSLGSCALEWRADFGRSRFNGEPEALVAWKQAHADDIRLANMGHLPLGRAEGLFRTAEELLSTDGLLLTAAE
jgi:hypothetical protein